MAARKLLWQLFLSYLIVILLSLLVVAWYAVHAFRDSYFQETHNDLAARARLAAVYVQPLVASNDRAAVAAYCRTAGASSRTRITVILPDGVVIGDSDEDPDLMDNHADRPEIMAAFRGSVGMRRRFSDTLKKQMMYVAVPLGTGDEVVGVVRASLPLQTLSDALQGHTDRILWVGIVMAVLAIGFSLIISRKISRPLEEMQRGAERFAQGQFDHGIPRRGSEELQRLSGALNDMARQLDRRIRTIARERNERGAILSSMAEGVLALDRQKRVMSINRAAAAMLGVDQDSAVGRSLEEVVRNPGLQALLQQALDAPERMEGEVTLHGESDRFIRVRCASLVESEGNGLGAVAVLNDITRLRKLENLRRDFVANVSHELRTPITSIKGFVETLLEEPAHDPEQSRRFLTIVARQADRLNAIIHDLLLLSRIEQDAEDAKLDREETALSSLFKAAIEVCAPRAKAKDIQLDVQCDDELNVRVNPALLEQAVVNLVDNAVKYSEAGSTVTLAAEKVGDDVRISVQDRGCGIPLEHHERLFERFYRVDSARSRSLGGTGLGLAIVKHIVQAHDGRVTVDSAPGCGSTFSIYLLQA